MERRLPSSMIDQFREGFRIVNETGTRKKIISVLCAFVLCAILTAGLWPFHAPRNEVEWLKTENGLRFGRHGTLLSSGTFEISKTGGHTGVSIEIWLRPDLGDDSSTVLAFYESKSFRHFSLRQSHADLVVQCDNRNGPHTKPATVYLGNVFREGTPVFITITAGAQGMAVYLDGALVGSFPQFLPSRDSFTGRMVVGDSPTESNSWPGQLRGLAIYGRDLPAIRVLRHYRSWTGKLRPEISRDDRAIAVYLFRERVGNVVQNEIGGPIHLNIPARYALLHETFLAPPWNEFRMDWGYWKNVLINIGGFTPLGFVFCWCFSLAWRVKRPGFLTLVLGASVSLLIEVLQAFLPTRQSGMNDLITNTLGTSIGIALYRQAAELCSRWASPLRS